MRLSLPQILYEALPLKQAPPSSLIRPPPPFSGEESLPFPPPYYSSLINDVKYLSITTVKLRVD